MNFWVTVNLEGFSDCNSNVMINFHPQYNTFLIIHMKAMMKSAVAAIRKQQQSATQPYRQHIDNTAWRQFLLG